MSTIYKRARDLKREAAGKNSDFYKNLRRNQYKSKYRVISYALRDISHRGGIKRYFKKEN
jgi:hypothetical protein